MRQAGNPARSSKFAGAEVMPGAGDAAVAERNGRAQANSNPISAKALQQQGLAHAERNELEQALRLLGRATALEPGSAPAWYNCGVVLHRLGRYAEALACHDKALALKPDRPDALSGRGNALRDLGRLTEALASYDKALALEPRSADVLNNRGVALAKAKRVEEALLSFDKAIAIRPDHASALFNRAKVLATRKHYDQALPSFEAALAANPDVPLAFSDMAYAALRCCDWARAPKIASQLVSHIERGTSVIDPFMLLGYGHDPRLQLRCTRTFLRHLVPARPTPLWNGAVWTNDKIRIAYVSSDFGRHATALLISELIEIHSRSRFEVLGIALSDDGSARRSRNAASFDRFFDVSAMSDREAAVLMHEAKVDIAVDLNGYTAGCRPGILAHKPAPVQVNWLGYPGTTAADFIDYIVADPIVLPLDQQPFYTERIVHLPDTFQVNDSRVKAAPHAPSRRQAGLPEQGFVFCCFNNNWKIAAPVFDIWMRLLHAVEGSVLWLLRENDAAASRLRDEARARDIDPSRLVFAPKIDHDVHLARHPLADLFLDTLPINAGTTASDALRAGVPVLTCASGRIAASLLHAIGLDDLVTSDLAEYETLAMTLAQDVSRLRAVRQRLERNRETHPLFDTARFRDHIEAAYVRMWDIWQRGELPQSFAVEPRSRRVD